MYTQSNRTDKKYAPSRDRAWWQRATPQFWAMAAMAAFIALAGIYGMGKLLFGRGYSPLSSAVVRAQDAATETPTPTATVQAGPTATPSGIAPWASQMNRMDNSKLQMTAQDRATYKYALPDDIRAQLEADWTAIVEHFYTLPYWRWYDPTLLDKYTVAGKLKPLSAGTPTATPIPTGTTLEVSTPGKRTVTLEGCDATGTTCQIVDIWTDITVINYAYNGATDKVIGSQPADGALAITAVLMWKDSKWKLQSQSAQNVQYVTSTPSGKS